jgi:hypothetical protein
MIRRIAAGEKKRSAAGQFVRSAETFDGFRAF